MLFSPRETPKRLPKCTDIFKYQSVCLYCIKSDLRYLPKVLTWFFFKWILRKIYTSWYLFGDEQIVSCIITKLSCFQKILLKQQRHLWLETGTKAIRVLLSQQDCIGLNDKLNDYTSPAILKTWWGPHPIFRPCNGPVIGINFWLLNRWMVHRHIFFETF